MTSRATVMNIISDYSKTLLELNPNGIPMFKTNLKRTTAVLKNSILPTDMSAYHSYVEKSNYHAEPVVECPVPGSLDKELALLAKPIVEKYNLKFGHVFMCIVNKISAAVPQHLHLASITPNLDGRSRAFSMFISNDGSTCGFEYFDKDVQSDALSHNLIARADNRDVLFEYTDSCPEEFKEVTCESGDIICFDSRKVLHGAEFKPLNDQSVGLWFVFDMCSYDLVEQTDLVVKIHEPLLD